MKIQRITGRQVFDSRGNPTVEAQVVLEDGSSVIGIAPAADQSETSACYEQWLAALEKSEIKTGCLPAKELDRRRLEYADSQRTDAEE